MKLLKQDKTQNQAFLLKEFQIGEAPRTAAAGELVAQHCWHVAAAGKAGRWHRCALGLSRGSAASIPCPPPIILKRTPN